MPKKEANISESEWAILKVVWEQQPCAAPGVQEALQGKKGWTYGTVKTLMDRMVKKGLLTTEKIRNLYLYRARISMVEARSRELLKSIKRAFDGAFSPAMQFLVESNKLTDEEIDDLKLLLNNKKKGTENQKEF
jgi:BlaI family transcriptional regulator, penicillinase repressor